MQTITTHIYDTHTHTHTQLMADTKLDFDTMSRIFKAGFSRIPVFAKETAKTINTTDNVIGVVFVKDMMLLDPSDCTPVATILQFYQHKLPRVFADAPIPELLDLFKEENTKMAVVQEISTGMSMRVCVCVRENI
jgi:metal transporter CNNM